MVHLVDRDHVRDLHDPRLERLDGVTGARHEHEQDDVGDADHLDLALPRADRLEEDEVLARGVDQQERLQRRLGQPAEMPTRAHRADVHVRIEEVVGEPDPVAQSAPCVNGLEGVDGDHADASPEPAGVADERAHERGLADPGGPVTPTDAARPVDP